MHCELWGMVWVKPRLCLVGAGELLVGGDRKHIDKVGHRVGLLLCQRLQERIARILIELDIELRGHVIRKVEELAPTGNR